MIEIDALPNIDAERKRIYALAELVARAWSRFVLRAPSIPPELDAAQDEAAKACDDVGTEWEDLLTSAQHLEGELVGVLDELATLYEIHDQITAGKPQ